jgi:hypothetical protein
MKRVVSISIGSSKRNKSVEVELLGEKMVIERIGTDGDMEKAAQMYAELDGEVDAFGVGGADLGMYIGDKWYTLNSVQKLVRFVKITPVVDGAGLKNTLEYRLAPFVDQNLGDYVKEKRAFVMSGVDRWGMGQSFLRAGYETVFGDLMIILGIPIALHSERGLRRAFSLLFPIASRLPFEWIYPTGEKQEKRSPKHGKYFEWATVIAGDCHYVKRYMPDKLPGRVICTNTTTPEDNQFFRQAGIKYLVKSTPVLDGRSFGTNVMEAALVAVSGKGRKLSLDELTQMIDQLGMEPQLQELN